MAAASAVALILRRIRREGAVLLLLFALVAATSFMFAAGPRLLNRANDEAIRYGAESATMAERDVWLHAIGTISPGNDPGVGAVRAYGLERAADFPGEVARLIADSSMGVTTVRFAVPESIVAVFMRHQEGVPDISRLTTGRWPVDRGMPLHPVRVGQQGQPGAPADPAVFEVALSTEQAEVIGVGVGDRLPIGLDISDLLVPRSTFGIGPTEVEVVGLYEPLDPGAEAWASTGLLQPTFRFGPSGIEAIYVTGFVAAEAYPNLTAGLLPFRYDWHFVVDPTRLDAERVQALQVDLQRLDLAAASSDTRHLSGTQSDVSVNGLSINTGLRGIIDGFVALRSRTESVLAIAALGVLGLAAGAIAMLAVMLVRRRRSGLLLARGRGASGAMLVGAQLVEALLLAGGAALTGLLLAIAAVPARAAPSSPVLALVVAAVTTLFLVGATWPLANRPLMQLEREDAQASRVAPRRLVIEGTIIAIAVVAIVLLRQRGLTVDQPGGSIRFDPLLAAVPLLAGLAAGIIAVRLYPLPVRGLSRIAARRRDFVPVAGLRAVARHPATARLPLLVLMLTAAFAAFASVVESSIERGQVTASYLEVGADFRLEKSGPGVLPAGLDPGTVPGVEAVAEGLVIGTANLVIAEDRRATVDFGAVDIAAYTTVTDGTAASPDWPRALMAQPSGADPGTTANPIPAVLSTQLPPGMGEMAQGATFTIDVAQRPLAFRVVGRQAEFPGHGTGATFVIAPLDWIRAAVPETSFAPTVLWLRASSDTAAALDALASAAPEAVRVVSRPAAYAALHDSPLGSAVARFFGIALVAAVVFMAVTLVGSVILSAADRTRDLAYLRTLGVTGRQARALTAVEHAPPALLTLVPGILLGVGVALLVEPGLGLADFVGARAAALSVDWLTLLAVIAVLSAVVVGAIIAGAWLAGRARLASSLRIEES